MRLALAVIALLQRRVEDVPPFLSVAQKWVIETVIGSAYGR